MDFTLTEKNYAGKMHALQLADMMVIQEG